MIPRSPCSRILSSIRVLSTSERSLQTVPAEHHLDIVRRRGDLITFPARLTTSPSLRFPANDGSQRLTKMLLSVNIENSLGPGHVVMSSDNTVNDLIKAAIKIYVKEKRRPLLEETDPKFLQLHYSQFSLERLKPGEKLIKLGSRNFFSVFEAFFLCSFLRLQRGKDGIRLSVFIDKVDGVAAIVISTSSNLWNINFFSHF